MYTYTHKHIQLDIYQSLSIYLSINIYLRRVLACSAAIVAPVAPCCVYASSAADLHTFLSLSLYIYIHICIHTHTHTYIYISS